MNASEVWRVFVVPHAFEPGLAEAALAAVLHADYPDDPAQNVVLVQPPGPALEVAEAGPDPQLDAVVVPAYDGAQAAGVLALTLLDADDLKVHIDHVLDLQDLAASAGASGPQPVPPLGHGAIVGVGRVAGQPPYLPGHTVVGQGDAAVTAAVHTVQGVIAPDSVGQVGVALLELVQADRVEDLDMQILLHRLAAEGPADLSELQTVCPGFPEQYGTWAEPGEVAGEVAKGRAGLAIPGPEGDLSCQVHHHDH